jgi:4-alpha-glucanotransferase
MRARAAGVLLHPTSLAGSYGAGDLGPEAHRFLRWAAQAGQRIWQVLPLGPTGAADSPYGTHSAFAGNPLLISLERLAEEGWLRRQELAEVTDVSPGRADFATGRRVKEPLLQIAWESFQEVGGPVRDDFEEFRRGEAQAAWLDDWALFASLKRKFNGKPWVDWPAELARREPDAVAAARRELASEIALEQFIQFVFFRQWGNLRSDANSLGIEILGDVPIYVVHDSADVWANRSLFALNSSGRPELVAGVPPDYFSETGQLWGYPLYRWDRMEQDGFQWWIDRFRWNMRLAGSLRVDHFRGFASYWAVDAAELTAVRGRWLAGPGRKLFDAVRAALPQVDLVAEDLGTITADVEALRDELGLPGMKVLQFAFSEDDSPHLPHRHVPNAVVYTGTHDNDTTLGWFVSASASERQRLEDYLGSGAESVVWDFIRAAYGSVADRAIVPMQDLLGLSSRARMNDPATPGGNWTWRLPPGELPAGLAERVRRLAQASGRLGAERSRIS